MKKTLGVLVIVGIFSVAGWIAYRTGWVSRLTKPPRPSEAGTPATSGIPPTETGTPAVPGIQQPEAGAPTASGSQQPEALPQNKDVAALDAGGHVESFTSQHNDREWAPLPFHNPAR
jgi:hypothetical protein